MEDEVCWVDGWWMFVFQDFRDTATLPGFPLLTQKVIIRQNFKTIFAFQD